MESDRPTGKEISIGIIGAGNIVRTMHLPILYNLPGVNVRYLADLAVDESLASPFNAEAIFLKEGESPSLPEVDLVFLATPPGARKEYAVSALAAGAAVFTEKPFAASVSDHKEMIGAGGAVGCTYNRRYFGNLETLEQIISGRILGQLREVRIVEAAMPRGTGKAGGHYQFDRSLSGGGVLMERGCHTLSQVDHVFINEGLSLTAAKIACIEGIDIEAELEIQLLQSNSKAIPIRYKIGAGSLDDTCSTYIFDNGLVVFDHTDPGAQISLFDAIGMKLELAPQLRTVRTDIQSFYRSWSEFLNKVRRGGNLDLNWESSIRTTELITEAYKREGLH